MVNGGRVFVVGKTPLMGAGYRRNLQFQGQRKGNQRGITGRFCGPVKVCGEPRRLVSSESGVIAVIYKSFSTCPAIKQTIKTRSVARADHDRLARISVTDVSAISCMWTPTQANVQQWLANGLAMQKKNNRVATATFTSIAVIVIGLLMIGMTSRAAEDIMGGDWPALTAGYAPRDSR